MLHPGCIVRSAASLTSSSSLATVYYNYYPSVEGKTFEEGALRIAAHTDYELFTCLFQRHPGLEVCPGKDTDAATAMEGGA